MKQLTHHHVNMFMAYVKQKNIEKSQDKPELRWSNDQIREIEKGIIKFVNRYNRIANFFTNNKLSLFTKNIFYSWFGTKYPEYMYNDEMDHYIVYIARELTRNKVIHFSATPVDRMNMAVDFSKYGYLKKRSLLKLVNQAINIHNRNLSEDNQIRGKFRYKKILEYK